MNETTNIINNTHHTNWLNC